MAVARISRAQRKARTREELVEAAYRVFTQRGFHGASLDLVAAEAGYTKGAVYSNFASKEDLFFAVYERRVDGAVARMEEVLAAHGDAGPVEMARRTLAARRGGSDDGWLAVFFEFWAHVLRHPELRERFLAAHRRAQEPLLRRAQELWRAAGVEDPERGRRWGIALFGMVTGAGLEQLTDPDFDGTAAVVELMESTVEAIRR